MGDGCFTVNQYTIPGPVIVLPTTFYLWGVESVEQVKPHSLEIFNFIKPRPDYLIIGTGHEPYIFHPAFLSHFKNMGIKIDVITTFQAIATFNSCVDDDKNVA